MRYLLRDWAVFLAILGIGLFTGFLVWAAGQPGCTQHCAVPAYYKGVSLQQAGP
jgi:hypothetical protein